MTAVYKYWLVIKLSWLDILEYRFDFGMSLLKYSFMVIMMALIWSAVIRENPAIDLTQQQTVVYFVLAAIVYSLSNFHTNNVEDDILQGTLSKFLVRPISPFWYYFSHHFAQVALETVLRLVVLLPALTLFGYQIDLPVQWLWLFPFYFSLIFFCAFNIIMFISTMAFWLHEVFAVRWALNIFFRLLSGVFVPLFFFPEWTQPLIAKLPFVHFAYMPIQIMQGNLPFTDIVLSVSTLFFWSVVFFVCRSLLWQAGVKSYQGSGI